MAKYKQSNGKYYRQATNGSWFQVNLGKDGYFHWKQPDGQKVRSQEKVKNVFSSSKSDKDAQDVKAFYQMIGKQQRAKDPNQGLVSKDAFLSDEEFGKRHIEQLNRTNDYFRTHTLSPAKEKPYWQQQREKPFVELMRESLAYAPVMGDTFDIGDATKEITDGNYFGGGVNLASTVLLAALPEPIEKLAKKGIKKVLNSKTVKALLPEIDNAGNKVWKMSNVTDPDFIAKSDALNKDLVREAGEIYSDYPVFLPRLESQLRLGNEVQQEAARKHLLDIRDLAEGNMSPDHIDLRGNIYPSVSAYTEAVSRINPDESIMFGWKGVGGGKDAQLTLNPFEEGLESGKYKGQFATSSVFATMPYTPYGKVRNVDNNLDQYIDDYFETLIQGNRNLRNTLEPAKKKAKESIHTIQEFSKKYKQQGGMHQAAYIDRDVLQNATPTEVADYIQAQRTLRQILGNDGNVVELYQKTPKAFQDFNLILQREYPWVSTTEGIYIPEIDLDWNNHLFDWNQLAKKLRFDRNVPDIGGIGADRVAAIVGSTNNRNALAVLRNMQEQSGPISNTIIFRPDSYGVAHKKGGKMKLVNKNKKHDKRFN